MTTDVNEVQSGLEGVVAFATEIAEPDREGGALRYRGVDIEELVGAVPYEKVWGLLVDGSFEPGLPPAVPHPLAVRSGDPRVDVQSALAMLAPEWGFRQLIDISDEQARDDLARASVMALSFVAQSARGAGQPAGGADRRRQGRHHRRALPHPLARRSRPRPREGHRRLLDLGRRARDERVDLHGARRRLDGRRLRRGALQRRGRAERAAARRRPLARAEDARRGGAARRRRALGQGCAGPRRAADGLRAPRLSRRGPARPRAAAHGARAGLSALRGRPRRSSAPRSPSCRRASPIACWPPTWSSGRPSCSTRPRCRRRSSPACSPPRAWRAGRRTSSSRSARRG